MRRDADSELTQENNSEKKPKIKSFGSFFGKLGLLWGIASFVFLVSEIGKEESAGMIMYAIFFPAYLNVWLDRLIIATDFGMNLWLYSNPWIEFVLFYSPSIIFGFFIGWLFGSTIDGLIGFYKPIEEDDRF